MPIIDLNLFEIMLIPFVWMVFSLLLVGIMHFLIPKKILQTYFKVPHFNTTEIIFFSAFPLIFMRTAMFMTALAFPSLGKVRGMTETYKLAPVWMCKASKYMIISLLASLALFLLTVVVGSIYMEFYM